MPTQSNTTPTYLYAAVATNRHGKTGRLACYTIRRLLHSGNAMSVLINTLPKNAPPAKGGNNAIADNYAETRDGKKPVNGEC